MCSGRGGDFVFAGRVCMFRYLCLAFVADWRDPCSLSCIIFSCLLASLSLSGVVMGHGRHVMHLCLCTRAHAHCDAALGRPPFVPLFSYKGGLRFATICLP